MSHLGGASVAPLDFAKVMEAFEQHHVAFVSVTQHFNSATSMGRLASSHRPKSCRTLPLPR
jgi:hypothetical protein